MYNMNAHPFFVHPYAHVRGNHGIPTGEQERRHPAVPSTSAGNDSGIPLRQTMPAQAIRGVMAEMKASLAANQLSEQVKESIMFWRGFQNEYSKEVNIIKLYVGVDVLQKIWRKKVEFKDDQQFAIQSMKLESCLNQFDEATQLLADTWSSDNSNDYDSRQHHLEKVRTTGNLVVGLSKTSETNEAACKDLLRELAELEKLIDPRSSAASTLHRFDKRQPRTPTRSEEGNAEVSNSNRPENGDTDNQVEQNNSNNWSGNNQQNSSNEWSGDNEPNTN
ncbi:hypothetical protein HD806DRAFT_111599 [Xylariaceae sp. AK1471]|nr:hypothetical protein HD806DRAFT_111599 [Xylariaceae sp. AK1471]